MNNTSIDAFHTPNYNLTIEVVDNYSESLSANANIEINVNLIEHFEASNIFTPGSSRNRYWTIRKVERYADYELTIRNSSGQIVYQTINYQNNWNGTYNNKQLPTGTYYYFLQKEAKLHKGFINIIYK